MTDREKLIEHLRWWAKGCDRTNSGCQVNLLLEKAADELANGVTVCEKETLHQMYLQGKYEGAYEGQKWIPVTKRLPDGEDEVLMSTEHGGQVIGCYDSKRREWLSWSDEYSEYYSLCGTMGKVTHWMPLPEPPRSTTD